MAETPGKAGVSAVTVGDAKQEALPKPASAPRFQFITFTTLDQSTDRQTRKKVRQHVMQGVRHSSKKDFGKRKLRAGEIALDISSLSPFGNHKTDPQGHETRSVNSTQNQGLNWGQTTSSSSNDGGPEGTPAAASPSKSLSKPSEIAHGDILGSKLVEQDRELQELYSHDSTLREACSLTAGENNLSQPSPGNEIEAPKTLRAGHNEEDELLETVMETFGKLDLDSEGNPSYHGHGSTSAFVRCIRERLSNMPGSTNGLESILQPPRDIQPSITLGTSDRIRNCTTLKSLLPAEGIARALVSSALNDACTLFRFIHQPSFFATFDRIYHIDHQLSTKEERFVPLLYAVLAVGSLYSRSCELERGSTQAVSEGSKYYTASQNLIVRTEIHDMWSLQALLFMIIYEQSSGQMSTCHSYVSSAIAAALQMGLHRCDPENLSPIKHETRKRVFWTIRIMETYIAAVLGLPRTLNDDDIDQELPAEIDDEYITGETMLQMPEGRISLLTGFNAHIKLSAILGKVITELYPTRKRKSNKNSPELYTVCNAKVKEVERILANWVRDLPVDLRPRSKMPLLLTRVQHLLQLAFTHVQMFLYRPFLHCVARSWRDKMPSRQSYAYAVSCVDVSREVIQNMRQMEEKNVLSGPYWFSIYTTFCATISLLFTVWENAESEEGLQILKDTECGRVVLFNLSSKSAAAAKNMEMLSVFCSHLPGRLETRQRIPTSIGRKEDHTQILLPEIDSNDETSKSQHNETVEIRQMSSFAENESNDDMVNGSRFNDSFPQERPLHCLNNDLAIYPAMNTMGLPTTATFEQLYLPQQSVDDEFDFSNMEFQDFLPFQSNSNSLRAEEMTTFPLGVEGFQQWYIPASSDPLQTAEYDAYGLSSLESSEFRTT